ncbi:MAG: hypothetical protein ABSF47_03010 [Minisyncoccia bacterium]|jgi:hypothetical protein
MSKIERDPHLIRVGKEFEPRLRVAAGVPEIVDLFRNFTSEHFRGRVWGYDRYIRNRTVVKEVVIGKFSSSKSSITLRVFCNTYLRVGSVEILLFLDCKPNIRDGSINFSRRFEIGNKDPSWEKVLAFFDKCARRGFSLRKSLFGER